MYWNGGGGGHGSCEQIGVLERGGGGGGGHGSCEQIGVLEQGGGHGSWCNNIRPHPCIIYR